MKRYDPSVEFCDDEPSAVMCRRDDGRWVPRSDVEAWQAKLLAMLGEIVVTEGCDAGVVMLSTFGPTHPARINGKMTQVYDYDYFSPLGDALIALRDAIKEA